MQQKYNYRKIYSAILKDFQGSNPWESENEIKGFPRIKSLSINENLKNFQRSNPWKSEIEIKGLPRIKFLRKWKWN